MVLLGDVSIPGEVLAAILGVLTVMGVGLGSWTLVTVVRLTGSVASLASTVAQLERTVEALWNRLHESERREMDRS